LKTGSKHNGVNPMRTLTCDLFALREPTEGKQFFGWGESLTKDADGKPLGTRQVNTSPVACIIETGSIDGVQRYWDFETESGSRYRVEEIGEGFTNG
jgi:hypothetical protein